MMDKKLLALLKSTDEANYLLVVQIYGYDNLLTYFLNIVKQMEKSEVDFWTRLGWFSFDKIVADNWCGITFNSSTEGTCGIVKTQKWSLSPVEFITDCFKYVNK